MLTTERARKIRVRDIWRYCKYDTDAFQVWLGREACGALCEWVYRESGSILSFHGCLRVLWLIIRPIAWKFLSSSAFNSKADRSYRLLRPTVRRLLKHLIINLSTPPSQEISEVGERRVRLLDVLLGEVGRYGNTYLLRPLERNQRNGRDSFLNPHPLTNYR